YPLNAGLAPKSRILRSATRSRSMVETPGTTASRAASSTWRTMRPLRRILSISETDLQTIDILDCTKRFRHYPFHRLIAVNFDQASASTVIFQQGQGKLLVGLQALGDDTLRIVRTRH